MDRGSNAVDTDSNGYYTFESALPAVRVVRDGGVQRPLLHDRGHLPGRQPADARRRSRAPASTSAPCPSSAWAARLDWGVHAYDPPERNGVDPRNGGIVGSVSYDTTRNELDPQYAASEDWQPGIPDVPVELYAPVECPGDGGAPCDATTGTSSPPTAPTPRASCSTPTSPSTGAGPPAAPRVTSTATRSSTAPDEDVLVPDQETDGECISSFMQGVQFGPYATDQGTPDANFGATVNGNYGFGDGCFNGTLDATDPADPVLRPAATSSRSAPATTSSRRHPGRRHAATRCTRSPARRTSTSATATRSSRRCRRRPAPARCTPSTSPATGHGRLPRSRRRRQQRRARRRDRAGLDPGRQRHLPRHRRLARTRARPSRGATPSSSSSTTASRSCRCSTSSPTSRSRPACAA